MKYLLFICFLFGANVQAQYCPDCSYHWRQVSGPVQTTIQDPDSATTNVTGLNKVGIYLFEFSVTNAFGTGKDTCSVTVISGSLAITTDSVYHFTRPEIKKLEIKTIARASDIFIQIKSPKSQRITVFLYDFMGRKLAQCDFDVMKGTSYVSLPKPRIPGLYILRFQTYFEVNTQKIFI